MGKVPIIFIERGKMLLPPLLGGIPQNITLSESNVIVYRGSMVLYPSCVVCKKVIFLKVTGLYVMSVRRLVAFFFVKENCSLWALSTASHTAIVGYGAQSSRTNNWPRPRELTASILQKRTLLIVGTKHNMLQQTKKLCLSIHSSYYFTKILFTTSQ